MFIWTADQTIYLLFTLIFSFIIAVILKMILKNKNEKIRSIPILIIAIIIDVLEIIKIIHSIKINNIYNVLPFHFCSMFLFWFPLSVISKGSFKQATKTLSFIGSTLMTILLYVFPSSIVGLNTSSIFTNFTSFHNFAFHFLVVLFLFLMIFLNIYKPKLKDIIYYIVGIICYSFIAVPGAIITKYNYTNILYSPIEFINNIRLAAGHPIYILCLLLIGIICGLCVWFIYYGIYKLIKKNS